MSLHPGELARARSAFATRFTATAAVMRKATVRDQTGGFTDSYVQFAVYACSFSRYPIRPLARENAPRVQAITEWSFMFPSGSDVRLTDRLKVGTRTFEVLDAGERSQSITLQVICLEIT